MPRPITTITLPAERGAQLRTLADHLGLSVSDMLDAWIVAGLKAAGLPDTLPGIDLSDCGDGTHYFSTKGIPGLILTVAELVDVAAALADAADRGITTRLILDSDDDITVARAGRGVTLDTVCSETRNPSRLTLTPNLARDLARQFRRAAGVAAPSA